MIFATKASSKVNAVITIFKNVDKKAVKKYRPFSLIQTFSKLIEKTVSNQLIRYLEEHELVTNDQFGFRTKSPTEKALHSMMDNLYLNFNQLNNVAGVF